MKTVSLYVLHEAIEVETRIKRKEANHHIRPQPAPARLRGSED